MTKRNPLQTIHLKTAAVLAVLAVSLGLGAQAQTVPVRLQPTASPTVAQAGVTSVGVVGLGFPSGTLAASSIAVAIDCGSGPVTTAAARVIAMAGTVRRINFTVPAAMAPAAPEPCQISLSGATAAGTAFASTNAAAVTLDPAAAIQLSPNNATAGQTVTIGISGTFTNFLQGSTGASFGPAISVAGAAAGAYGTLTVSSPTFASASITIAANASGPYTVTVASGIQTATATFTVLPPANSPPTAVIHGPYSGTAGQSVSFSAAGSTDPDGDSLTYAWNFGDGGTGTGASPSHTYAVGGSYNIALTVDDGHGNQASGSTTATITDLAPVANAGPSQTVQVGKTVLLDGSGSTGNHLSYQWSFLAVPPGSNAALQNANQPQASFIPDVFGPYLVQLKVTDTSSSQFSTATTTVAGNTPPNARIVVNPVAQVGSTVVLDGSQSTDPDGDALTFQWQVSGSGNPTLNTTDPVHPTFVAPQAGPYVVTLTVTDTDNLSSQAQATISSQAPPVANPGLPQLVVPGTVVNLDGTGSTDPNGVAITGYAWTLTVPNSSTATLQNANTAQPSFTPDIAGTYIAQLIVTDADNLVSLPQTVAITSDPRPLAVPGADQVVMPGVAVHLDGSGSSSPANHVPLQFAWSFTAVPVGSAMTNASLSGANTAQPSFTPDLLGSYSLQLVVTDSLGLASLPATVSITQNTRPVAKATATPATISPGSLVQLDASQSTDVDGDALTYLWTLSPPQGSAAVLSNTTAINPTFTADITGTYTAQVTVTDSFGLSATATVSVGSEQPPTANAGPTQSVPVGATVTLDGSGSSDPQNETLSYHWTFTQWPNSGTTSAPLLSSASAAKPSFTANQQGLYIVQLVVTNADGLHSQPSAVTINGDAAPTAKPGAAQTVSVGATVQLDGTGSSDPNGLPLSYHWTVLSWPPSNTPPAPSLSDPNSASPTFTASAAGQYQLQLIVSDGVLSSTPQTVLITAQYPAPVASIAVTPGANVNVTTLVNLDGFGSTGNGLTYAWAFIAPLPVGSTSTLANATSAQASFTPDVAGTYTVQLTVTDSASRTSTAQTTITAALPALTLTLSSPLVAVNRDISGTVSIPAPAPSGGLVVSIATSVGGVVTVPSTATIPATETSIQFAVTGAATGNTILTASATGYAPSAGASVGVTGSAISLANNLVLAPGHSNSIALSLSTPAPSGGVTVTLTSAEPGIATVTSTVTVPAGSETPTANPQVTGVDIGTAHITASAPGYAPDTEPVQVTLTASLSPNVISVPATNPTTVTISLSTGGVAAAAPAGGVTFTLSTDDSGVATVPQTVTIPQGSVSASFTLNGVAHGSTILRADAPGIAEVTVTVSVSPAPAINSSGGTYTAADLQNSAYFYLSAAPPPSVSSVAVTVSVATGGANCTGCLLIASNATDVGSSSLTYTLTSSYTATHYIYLNGVAPGTTSVTISAPGYATATFPVTVYNSGFFISGGSSNVGTFAGAQTFTVSTAVLQANGNYETYGQSVRPGVGPFTIPLTLGPSGTNVGTLDASSVTISTGSGSAQAHFTPQVVGTATVSITQPSGFLAPANLPTQISYTVVTPTIGGPGSITIAAGNSGSAYVYLTEMPPNPVAITLTVAGGGSGTVLLSATSGGTGSSTLILPGVASTGTQDFYVQGLAHGTTTITVSAPGYQDLTLAVTVN